MQFDVRLHSRTRPSPAPSADSPLSWQAVAEQCRARGDEAGEEAAIRAQLTLSGRDLAALLAMGDLLARRGDERGASSHFRTALQTAAASGYPPSLLQPLAAAQAYVQQAEARFADQVQQRLHEAGLRQSGVSPRVNDAIRLLLGEAQLHVQQPNMFYFPGLPQRPFFEREEFGWAAGLEGATPAIRAELEALIASGHEGLGPHIRVNPRMPPPVSPLLDDPSWSAFHLWQRGREIAANVAAVPRTVEALQSAPIPRIAGSAPMVMFSLLRPGTHIAPHHGITNTRLICHLPILAPEGCALRVGSEVRAWEEGRLLIFDDSFEHEAWNRGEELRAVLLFEIWRPDISASERDEIAALFEAVELDDSQAAH